MLDQNKLVDAAKAEDLGDLLDHIAWTDILKPIFEKQKKDLSARLTASVLGKGREGELRTEQIAGMYYGIDIVIGEIEKILRKGLGAREYLENHGLNLDL